MAINSTPYDFSGAYFVDISTEQVQETFELHDVVAINTSNVAKLTASGLSYGDTGHQYSLELPIDDPNGTYTVRTGGLYPGEGGVETCILTAYDSAENILQSYEVPKNVPTPKGDWDVSGLTMTGDRGLANTVVSGITGSDPVCTTIRFITTDEDPYYGIEYVDKEVSNNNPNGDYNIGQGFIQDFENGPKIVLLDANGDTIASTATFSLTLTGYPEN